MPPKEKFLNNGVMSDSMQKVNRYKSLLTRNVVLRCNLQQVLDGETLSEEIKLETIPAQGDQQSDLVCCLFIVDLHYELRIDKEITKVENIYFDLRTPFSQKKSRNPKCE